MAGIAAMVLTGILGTAMGLNNTAAFMSSCVAFVAVSMWMDSRSARRRRNDARRSDGDPGIRGEDPRLAFDSDTAKGEGRGK